MPLQGPRSTFDFSPVLGPVNRVDAPHVRTPAGSIVAPLGDHRTRTDPDLPDLGGLTACDLPALTAIFRDTMSKLRTALRDPHFSLALHSGPLTGGKDEEFHWHWELIPHLSGELGMEWATGVYFNPIAPEDAAACLREGEPLG